MEIEIRVENNDVLAAMRGFLHQLFEIGLIEALFVPLETPGGFPVPALVTQPAQLETANPFAPLMPINSARAVSALTGKRAPGRLGAVLRPCEIRALVELVKLNQASLEGVTLIGMDCLGTCELADYRKVHVSQSLQTTGLYEELFSAAQAGRDPRWELLPLRSACQVCSHPEPEHTQIHVHLLGAQLSLGLPITVADGIAEQFQPPLPGVETGWRPEKSRQAASQLISNRNSKRKQELDAIRSQIQTNGGIASLFDACIRCHNCMTACPICYCKTCLFKSAAFDHEPEYYYSAAGRKGAQRLLGDTFLFHLTRLNHMSPSCVSCGMCSSACPSDIPVGMIFSAVAEQVQAAFEYIPGRDVGEALPLVTFKADEWTTVGEES